MAAYFQSTHYDEYLPPEIASASDVADIASEAEAAVKAHYTRRVRDVRGTVSEIGDWEETGNENLTSQTGTVKVYLLHYETDADDVDTTDSDENAFLLAMRRAIAAQARHTYYRRQRDPTLRSETRGARSWTYGEDAGRISVCSEVEMWLKPFDTRPVTFVI